MSDVEITVGGLKARLDAGHAVVLLDVRTPGEVATAHIEGAKVISLQELVARYAAELDPEADIVCFCHHGMRSMQATMFLRQQGFTAIRSLQGGIDAWSLAIDPSVPRY